MQKKFFFFFFFCRISNKKLRSPAFLRKTGNRCATRNVLSLGRPKQNAQPVIFGKGDMQNSFKIFKKMFQKLLKKLLKKSQNLFKKIIKKNLKLLKNFQNF